MERTGPSQRDVLLFYKTAERARNWIVKDEDEDAARKDGDREEYR